MSTPVNRVRGEAGLEIGNVIHRLCLTLGALAEIEAALGAETLSALESRLKLLSARDMSAVLAALLRGGGNPLSEDLIAKLPLDLAAVTHAITQAFAAAGLGAPPAEPSRGEVQAPPETLSGGAGSRSALADSGLRPRHSGA